MQPILPDSRLSNTEEGVGEGFSVAFTEKKTDPSMEALRVERLYASDLDEARAAVLSARPRSAAKYYALKENRSGLFSEQECRLPYGARILASKQP